MQNNGAYLQLLTPAISHLTLFMVPGPYAIPHVSITIDQAFTHTTPTDAYRGAGRPEATHGLERLMDEIADELGIDPAERAAPQLHPRSSRTRPRSGCRTTPATTQARSTARSSSSDYAGFESRRAGGAAAAAGTAASASPPTSRSAASRRPP